MKADIPFEVNDHEGNPGLAAFSMLRVGITQDHSVRPCSAPTGLLRATDRSRKGRHFLAEDMYLSSLYTSPRSNDYTEEYGTQPAAASGFMAIRADMQAVIPSIKSQLAMEMRQLAAEPT